jgi:antitoxin (DNA-binding transcriptional repressor) of toxin-antitoxin stability system
MEVTVQEAKTQLLQLLRRVEGGEEIVILRGRRPVAMLVRAPARAGRRQIWADLEGEVAEDFDEPSEEFAPYT